MKKSELTAAPLASFRFGMRRWLYEQFASYDDAEVDAVIATLFSYIEAEKLGRRTGFGSEVLRRSWDLALGYFAESQHATDESLGKLLGVKAPPR